MRAETLNEPLTAKVEDGQVLIEGGAGTALTMTADAAAKSAENILMAATIAIGDAEIAAVHSAGFNNDR